MLPGKKFHPKRVNATTCSKMELSTMDRTVIDTWKAEEKEFSEKLHKKLLALSTMIHPATDEFKKCLSEDMFLKPNQRAFFHVMHYIFTLLDPVEFKKRFYWPIVDKKSEATFRSTTIQYLAHLNEKHNLQWTNIKSYLVVMPGGMKFILFLLDLIDFVTKELIKQREKCIPEEDHVQLANFNIKRLKAQNKIHKEYASRYIKAMDSQIVNIKENLEALRKHINTITIPDVQITDLLQDSFLSEFAANTRKLFEKNLKQKVEKVSSIEEPLKNLKEVIERFQNHEASIKYDTEKVKRSLLTVKRSYPDIELGVSIHDIGNNIQLNTLLTVFSHVFPDIENSMKAVDEQNNQNEFMAKELSTLKTDILQIETQISKFMASISDDIRTGQVNGTPIRFNAHSLVDGGFFSKFINTPPIRIDVVDNKVNNPRLPFLDDFTVERSIETFCFANQQNTVFPSLTVSKSAKKLHDNLMKPSQNTVTKSKIIDPLRLLRSLNKDTSKSKNISRNLSTLASKWKKHESLFQSDDPDASQIEQCKTVVTMTVNSPFCSNERTKIRRQQLDISLTANTVDSSFVYSRKFSAVQKVQDASLNFHNLSTSPSGRLDPLVSFDPKEFPKILLNDKTLLDTPDNKSQLINALCVEECSLSRRNLKQPPTVTVDESDSNENNPNASNVFFDFKTKLDNISSDAIFDISDGVLKDITM